jgi:hypothetical protein
MSVDEHDAFSSEAARDRAHAIVTEMLGNRGASPWSGRQWFPFTDMARTLALEGKPHETVLFLAGFVCQLLVEIGRVTDVDPMDGWRAYVLANADEV